MHCNESVPFDRDAGPGRPARETARRTRTRSLGRLIAALGLAVAVTAPGAARAAWPERPLRIVVPYPPGAVGDVVARFTAGEMQTALGQPVIVENRPGASGNIGTLAVVRAPADGHTLLLAATNNFVINQFLRRDIGFDPLASLAPLTILVDVPSVVYASAAVPAASFREFAQWARTRRGKVNYGSPGQGTTPHLTAEIISKRFDLGMIHVPYQGAAQGIQALLVDEVQFYLVGAAAGQAHVRNGKLRAFAVASETRHPGLPDVPTFREAGLEGIRASNWWGMAAPRDTPPALVEQISGAFRAALRQPGAIERFRQLGLVPVLNTPKEMAAQLADEARYWERSLAEAGIKAE